jgi:hypothetical protein
LAYCVRDRYDPAMQRLHWFLVLAIALQLCLGSVWASPMAAHNEAAPQRTDAARVAEAHCHEEGAVEPSAVADSASATTKDAGHSCCSANHCHLCSAAGLPIQTIATVSLPDTPNISTAALVLVSWVLPPELRPPI